MSSISKRQLGGTLVCQRRSLWSAWTGGVRADVGAELLPFWLDWSYVYSHNLRFAIQHVS